MRIHFFFALALVVAIPCQGGWDKPLFRANCFDALSRLKPKSPGWFQRYVDKSKRKQWLAAQPESLQPVLGHLASNIPVISHREFQRTLFKTFDAYLAERDPNRQIVFTSWAQMGGDDAYNLKSGVWVVQQLREHYGHNHPALKNAIFYMPEENAQKLGKPPASFSAQTHQVVYIDDFSAGGTQISTWRPVIRRFYQGDIAVVVPFMSEPARRRFEEDNRGAPAKLYTSDYRLATLEDILNLSPRRDEYFAALQTVRPGWFFPERPHFTFAHHRPEPGISNALQWGLIFEDQGDGTFEVSSTAQPIPFLTEIQKPYGK